MDAQGFVYKLWNLPGRKGSEALDPITAYLEAYDAMLVAWKAVLECQHGVSGAAHAFASWRGDSRGGNHTRADGKLAEELDKVSARWPTPADIMAAIGQYRLAYHTAVSALDQVPENRRQHLPNPKHHPE